MLCIFRLFYWKFRCFSMCQFYSWKRIRLFSSDDLYLYLQWNVTRTQIAKENASADSAPSWTWCCVNARKDCREHSVINLLKVNQTRPFICFRFKSCNLNCFSFTLRFLALSSRLMCRRPHRSRVTSVPTSTHIFCYISADAYVNYVRHLGRF